VWCACGRWESAMLLHTWGSALVETARRESGVASAKKFASAAGCYEKASCIIGAWKNLPSTMPWSHERRDGQEGSALPLELDRVECERRAVLCEVLAHVALARNLGEHGSVEERSAESIAARWHALVVLADPCGGTTGADSLLWALSAACEVEACRAAAGHACVATNWSEALALRNGAVEALASVGLTIDADVAFQQAAKHICSSLGSKIALPYSRSCLPERIELPTLRRPVKEV
jgi:hypothetical protein